MFNTTIEILNGPSSVKTHSLLETISNTFITKLKEMSRIEARVWVVLEDDTMLPSEANNF